jgi:hypothetical protein
MTRIVFIFFSFCLLSCLIKPPEIVNTSIRLIVSPNGESSREESLSFFANINDPDGIDHIEFIYIVHDESELSWKLDRETWIQIEDEDTFYFGTNGFSTQNGIMPRGQYRIIAIDKAGEKCESVFTLSAPDTSSFKLPSAYCTNNILTVDSPYPSNTAIFLDAGGNVSRTVPVSAGANNLDALSSDLFWRQSVDYLILFAIDPSSEIGLLSWKIRLPDQ